jgi:hypothetical protein
MSIICRQSTARTVMVGPVLDEDGVAVTDAVVGDLEISKNGADPAAFDGSATLTHRNTGHYSLALTANDLDTVGQAEVVINKTTDAMPIKAITVIEEAVYDALFAASANTFTGAAGASKVTGVVLTDTLTTYTGDTPQTADHTTSIAAAKVVIDAVAAVLTGITSLAQWLGLIAGKQTGNSTARTELRATGAGSGTYDETTDSQEATRDRGDAAWITGAGGGTGARTIAITVDDGTDPIEGASIRFTKGAESYVQQTNVSGQATFNLDDGTWTVAITEAGYTFTGTTLVVDGDETPTYSMTAVSITPAAGPDQTTGYLTTRNGQGTVEGGVVIDFALVLKNDSGQSYESDKFSATSHATTGLLEVTLIRGGQYVARRGDIAAPVPFTAGNDATYELPQVLGLIAANAIE